MEELFNLFVSKDRLWERYHKPFVYKDKIGATDTYSMIVTNATNVSFEITNTHVPPNLDASLPKENTNELIVVDKDAWEALKTEDELIEITPEIECKECEGEGEVEWTYKYHTEDFDCPVCNGSGIEQKAAYDKTGNKVVGKSLVKIKDAYFDAKLFQRILSVSDFEKKDLYLMSYRDKRSAAMFRCGIFYMLLMPILASEDTLEDYEHVLKLL